MRGEYEPFMKLQQHFHSVNFVKYTPIKGGVGVFARCYDSDFVDFIRTKAADTYGCPRHR